MTNVGRVIKDAYCNGYFGRGYDLEDAVIINEGAEYIVVRKDDGLVDFCSFQQTIEKKQELIDEWCSNREQ